MIPHSAIALATLSGMGALTYFTLRLRESRRLHRRCVRLCHRIADELSQPQDPELVTERIFRVVIEHTNAAIGVLSFFARKGNALEVIRVHGLPDASLCAGTELADGAGWICPRGSALERPQLLHEGLKEALAGTGVTLDARQNMICIPVQGPGGIGGLLQLISAPGQSFHAQHVTDLSGVGFYLGAAIHNARLIDTIRRKQEASEILYEIGLNISRIPELDSIIRYAVEQGHRVVDSGFTWFLDGGERSGDRLTLRRAAGAPVEGFAPGDPVQLSAQVATLLHVPAAGSAPAHLLQGDMLADSTLALFCDPSLHHSFRAHRIASALIVPVRSEQVVRGLLCSFSNRLHAFDTSDLQFMQRLANQLLIALNTAELHTQRQRLAVAEERQRLSDELHDNMAQVINGVALEIHSLAKRGRSAGVDSDLLNQMQRVAGRMQDAKASIRQSIFELRLPEGSQLWENLGDFATAFERWHELEVRTELPDSALQQSPERQREVLRIVQEALWNIRKHSGSDHALVQGDRDPVTGRVRIRVRDHGRGANPATLAHGQGVATMRNRAVRLGGRLELRPGDPDGLELLLELPA